MTDNKQKGNRFIFYKKLQTNSYANRGQGCREMDCVCTHHRHRDYTVDTGMANSSGSSDSRQTVGGSRAYTQMIRFKYLCWGGLSNQWRWGARARVYGRRRGGANVGCSWSYPFYRFFLIGNEIPCCSFYNSCFYSCGWFRNFNCFSP